MSKTKTDKKVNRIAKKVNKNLKQDLFGDRFWIKQIQKARGEDGLEYYLYELKDRLEPNRDTIFSKGWLWGDSQFLISDFFGELNDFIVRSDFWAIYHNKPESYNRESDVYLTAFNKLSK
jgi:hypothetical protein